MSLKLRWSLCALGATMLAGPLVAQDLTLVFKETGASGQKTSTQYFTKDRLRHNFADHDTIFEYATGKITNIDHKKKEYSEITLADIEAQMKAASAEMEKSSAREWHSRGHGFDPRQLHQLQQQVSEDAKGV